MGKKFVKFMRSAIRTRLAQPAKKALKQKLMAASKMDADTTAARADSIIAPYGSTFGGQLGSRMRREAFKRRQEDEDAKAAKKARMKMQEWKKVKKAVK